MPIHSIWVTANSLVNCTWYFTCLVEITWIKPYGFVLVGYEKLRNIINSFFSCVFGWKDGKVNGWKILLFGWEDKKCYLYKFSIITTTKKQSWFFGELKTLKKRMKISWKRFSKGSGWPLKQILSIFFFLFFLFFFIFFMAFVIL